MFLPMVTRRPCCQQCCPRTDTRLLRRIDADTSISAIASSERERPFVMRLDPADPEPVERAAYDASYKGVTDALTLYLWRRPAFYLTRWAASGDRISSRRSDLRSAWRPFLFMAGWYWTGIAAGSGELLDTVDGSWPAARPIVELGQHLRPWRRPGASPFWW